MMARAVEGGRLFHRDVDRKLYLGLLQLVIERHEWQVMTFALMETHLHLLVIATTKQMSDGLWWMHRRYAEHYKRAYRPHFGHVFGGRPKTKPIEDDRYFLAVARYIARNPVGVFCSRAEDYKWSAHGPLVGTRPALPIIARDELLGWFGPTRALDQYQAFVAGRDPEEHQAVRRWATGPPEDRPELDALVGDPTPEALLIAHDMWEYSMRSISRTTGINFSAVRNTIARARLNQRTRSGDSLPAGQEGADEAEGAAFDGLGAGAGGGRPG
jgi:REP element-mobilizing transposase RayT